MSGTGIVAYGAYVPYFRLKRASIGEALQQRAGKGQRAVASYDEDTVTMAVEAARAVLRGTSDPDVRRLTFATTNPPYQEKLNAAIVHAALNLPPHVRAMDVGFSIRSGLAALLDGADASLAGGRSLVSMADIRVGPPEGAFEQIAGDGAAAFLVGTDDLIAEIEAMASITDEYLSTWRATGDRFRRSAEERFVFAKAYVPLLVQAARELLTTAGTTSKKVTAVVLDAPHPQAVAAAARAMELPPERVVDGLFDTVGHTGAAHAGLQLAAALDRAAPGDRIAVLSVSDGVDAVLLRVTDAIAARRGRPTVAELVTSARDDLGYARYLKWRGVLETEPPRRPEPDAPAAPPSLRSEDWKFAFVGSECKACGTSHLPPQILCIHCGKEDMKPVPFADRKAHIRLFTADRLAYSLQPPLTAALLDFEGGGRCELEVADVDPSQLANGMQVELTFRRLFTAKGVHNYFWKARPVRGTTHGK